jgi:hypothetical protein
MTRYKKFDFLSLDVLYLMKKNYINALANEHVQNDFFAMEFIMKKLGEVKKEINRRNKRWSM